MEAARNLSRTNFMHSCNQFTPPGAPKSSLNAMKVWLYPTQESRAEYYAFQENEATQLADIKPSEVAAENPGASLSILFIPRDDLENIAMSRANFLQVFESFGLDPFFLDLLSWNWYGIQSSGPYKDTYTTIISILPYVLIFSFNPITFETRAICLPRDSDGLRDASATVDTFKSILANFTSLIYSPYALTLTVLFQLAPWLDEFAYTHLQDIRETEQMTNHGSYGNMYEKPSNTATPSKVQELMDLSKRVGLSSVNLANCERHQTIAMAICDYLEKETEKKPHVYCSKAEFVEKLRACIREVAAVLPHIKTRIQGCAATTKYLQERVRTQSTVIWSLLTHEDTSLTLELADCTQRLTEQSTNLAEKSVLIANRSGLMAEQALKDSSSMKTISVMTMAFLPGTFFAALFALPSLKWDESVVVQDRFWVYWVFTLPATLLVFVLWFLLTQRKSQPETLGMNAAQLT
ncbi:hypothetical protein B0I35DRAFT_100994 [Stachybotrys elegans]|uniref:Uncharacterized protein n=1 Tax=Stachybotrys elegans TaxID=80388 RepID=A0A8K0SJZ9_9HYPO|nr:hypothetical protein B0I35DRAFT_100994 [Stachybotrys elegans]